MMSEDLASTTISMAEKSVEIAAELARLLKSIYDNHISRQKERQNGKAEKKAEAKDVNDIKSGEVKLSELKKAGSPISMQSNISAQDMKKISEKAKEYDISVSFIGKETENVKIAFRTDDKAAVNQILQDVLTEKLTVKPKDYLTFEIGNLGEAQTLSAMLKENNIPADIAKGADGKYQCVYEAKNADDMKIIKSDLKEAHESISNDFDIENNGKKYTLSDKAAGKRITLSSLPTKEKLMRICREQFGFSDCKANEAANKFESTLSRERQKFFRTDTRQAELLNNFDRNIKLSDDSLLVKPFTFTRANFSSDNVNQYYISDGKNAVKLIPEQMSREEMENIIKEGMGISSDETVKAIVDKTEKIQVVNKIEEIKKEMENIKAENSIAKQKGDISIERKSDNFFEVGQGALRKSYDINDKNQTVKDLQKDFGISKDKAETIFKKAQRQSTLQNDFHNLSQNKQQSKDKKVEKKKADKGARK